MLSERESDVLRLVARGEANKQIARELGIAPSTVKSHVGSLMSKLGLGSRTQLALYAARSGLVALDQNEVTERQTERFDGLSVIALFVFAVAVMDGVVAQTMMRPGLVLGLIALAFATSLGLESLRLCLALA